MAPLTRNRSTMPGRVPNDLMREYYKQRATAGLIITEATSVSAQGVGYPQTPGIWSEEQTEGWRKIVDDLHLAGGKIVMQLWHVGRISDPEYLGGELPVAPSAIAAKGTVSLLRPQREYVTPRALTTDEVKDVVEQFRRGAENAKAAGFDGVEIHGANGYLLDQFLQDGSNKRTDEYGGPIENRARLPLEVTDAVIGVWGAGRVGFHIAPRGDSHDMGDSDLAGTFDYLVRELDKRGIAFIAARESADGERFGPKLRQVFSGVYIANEGFTARTAKNIIAAGEADAVAFGKLFISNPDLVLRLKTGAEFNEWKAESFYGQGPEGYTDYPALEISAAVA